MNRANCVLIPTAVLVAILVDTSIAQLPKTPNNVELLRDVAFGKGGNQKLTMHVLRPKTLPKEPMPVLVYIHGSAWGRDNADPQQSRE
jgi:acetyl esterase/lipase